MQGHNVWVRTVPPAGLLVYEGTHRGQRLTSGIFPQSPSALFFRMRSVTRPGAHFLSGVIRKIPGIQLSPLLYHWVRHMHHHAQLWYGHWGSKLRSSHWHSNTWPMHSSGTKKGDRVYHHHDDKDTNQMITDCAPTPHQALHPPMSSALPPLPLPHILCHPEYLSPNNHSSLFSESLKDIILFSN